MFYIKIFLFFERNEMYRKVFYTFTFLQRKISITSKMFYFKNTRVIQFNDVGDNFLVTKSELFQDW